MKRRMAVTAVVLSVMFAASGCAVWRNLRPETPEQEWALAVLTYSYMVDTAIDLHDAGRLTDEQFLTVDEIRRHVDRALDAWRLAIEHGLDTEEAERRYRDAIERIEDILDGAGG